MRKSFQLVRLILNNCNCYMDIIDNKKETNDVFLKTNK